MKRGQRRAGAASAQGDGRLGEEGPDLLGDSIDRLKVQNLIRELYVALTGAFPPIRSRKVTPHEMKLWGTPTASPLTWALSGGDGIRTHGLYIANVWITTF